VPEILIVVAIVGILATILPFVFNRRGLELGRATNDILNLIQVARFEAIKRNRPVIVSVENNAVRSFVDSNNNASFDTGEFNRLVRLSGYGTALALSTNLSNSKFLWTADGLPQRVGSTAFVSGTIALQSAGTWRCIKLSQAGRLRKDEGVANCSTS